MPEPWKKHFRRKHVRLDDNADNDKAVDVTTGFEDLMTMGRKGRHDEPSSSGDSSEAPSQSDSRCSFLPRQYQPTEKNPDVYDDVVESTAIYDSADEEVIEVEQVFEEGDTDTSTIQTNTSDFSLSDDPDGGFEVRVAERLVHLHQIPTVRGASAETGSKRNDARFKCSMLRLSSVKQGQNGIKTLRPLARPRDLLGVEKGTATIICRKPSKAEKYCKMKQPGNGLQDSVTEVSSEVGTLGGAWRGVLRRLVEFTLDDVNALRLGRALQVSLPFLTGFESYLMSLVIEALDTRQNVAGVLSTAFQNRNVSRLIVQALGPRHDFLYHWGTAITWNRQFDLLGQFPIIGGLTRFPATENFPSTRDHALASIFRVVLGQGNWLTRVVTGGREGLITDDPNNTAQNLTAESNGFEQANRNQYGTHFGRVQTNEFRFDHRLPTDESLVRTFVAQPISTLTNNGVVHCLRQLSKHWHNMLSQEWGNFAHQRMEQLDPFETLRFHMPEVLLTLSSLRGRNKFDADKLGSMVQLLQSLRPGLTAGKARKLVRTLERDIVVPVCGGIPSVVEPFMSWLSAIRLSLDRIEEEAKSVFELVSSVELGIRLGHDVMAQVGWQVPADSELKESIIRHILGESTFGLVSERVISRALESTTPRDKRTLFELVRHNLVHTRPARMLLARVKTLIQRELRRDTMNDAIRELSKGNYAITTLVTGDWYWLEDKDGSDLYIYRGKNSCGEKHQFANVDSGSIRLVSKKRDGKVSPKPYIPVAEAITRAQKTFMTIELNHGKVFSYNAFMEFSPLRVALRRLIVVSQMSCEVLDNARLNVLGEIQRTSQKQTSPQNIVVVGGGPAGMMTVIHCTENCLVSGGVMKLYEARDTFAKGGSTYERAQIVRLDSRWISMLRYHLGTGFEDVFIPTSGETDSQLGNTLPTQGFVEITIKDLENMLHVEISRLWSRGAIAVFTDSRSQFNHATNSLTKLGEKLKIGDVVLRKLNCEGRICNELHRWKVVELVHTKSLEIDDLKVGEEYRVYYRPEQAVLPFVLVEVKLETKTYHFKSLLFGIEDFHVSVLDLPSIYPAETDGKAHADVRYVVLESIATNSKRRHARIELLMAANRKRTFTLDVGNTHVIEAIGKPTDSQVHFRVTTPEPYGVCCMEGLKVSMGMHNFGEKRWGNGIVDDIRSLNDQNTRIIGDFTKMVRTSQIVESMRNIMFADRDWVLHFDKVATDSNIPATTPVQPVLPIIMGACQWLAENSKQFRRQTLQTRFFEVGDNFYLGMELPREYDQWKRNLTNQIVPALDADNPECTKDTRRRQLADEVMHSIDRLWYFACLETIRTGDVYNPGARRRVPRLYLINSSTSTTLGSLPAGESFRLLDLPQEKYEILATKFWTAIVRNVEGYVFRMSRSTKVKRESNLTRSPDGNVESRVALSSFPVSHYVNHRTMRLSDADKGYVFAFTGDEQATPHFMRYSGLTGACINAMSFNVFVQKAIEGVPFVERFREYSKETNWSNGEVVQRGTGANYGEDGFLRPGFPYDKCIDYLSSKFVEFRESGQDMNETLSRDWKTKIAASLVPRGMELNSNFTSALRMRLQDAVFKKFVEEVRKDDVFVYAKLDSVLNTRHDEMDPEISCSDEYWLEFISGLRVDGATKEILGGTHLALVTWLNQVCREVIDFAARANLYNERVSSELSNQPKPVDSVVDDFAVEAQTFANSLTLAAAFGAGTLAFRLVDRQLADVFSAILGALNILIAFGTMTNCSRYKIRNEEARIVYMDEKFSALKKSVFSLMNRPTQASVPKESDPFVASLQKAARRFRRTALYYDCGEPHEFNEAFSALERDIHNEDTLKGFQEFLTRRLIADIYQTNSYMQESLVEVYRLAEETLHMQKYSSNDDNTKAVALFNELQNVEIRLEHSLQRGPVRWGFIKVRKVWHWDIMVVIRYFCNIVCCCQWPGCRLASIQTELTALLRQMRRVSKGRETRILSREIRDMETFYWATRESDIASLIFVVASLTFAASTVFTVARILSINVVTDLAFFSAAASALGAILASFHLFRKFFILAKLWIVLWSKARIVSSHQMADLRLVRGVTLTQIMLTVTRFCAATAAAIAFPFSIAETGFGTQIDTRPDLPFWIALGAILAAIGSTLFFFVVEYIVRYRLPTELGPFVCGLFECEINQIHRELSEAPTNSVDTRAVQDREAWEYTARAFLHKWRFDTVFAADRFGQILQFIQSGRAMKDLEHPR